MIPLKDKSIGYLFSIEKGGEGSGIIGHRIVQRVSSLENLQSAIKPSTSYSNVSVTYYYDT